MVVLTLILAKAAYDRYSSSNLGEVEVIGEGGTEGGSAFVGAPSSQYKFNNNSGSNNNRDNSNNNGGSNHHHHINQYPTQSIREARTTSSSSSSRVVTRKPSFHREIHSSTKSSKSVGRRRNRGYNSSAALLHNKMSASMNSNNLVSTRHGNFVVDTKSKLLLLPPEGTKSGNKLHDYEAVTAGQSKEVENINEGGHAPSSESGELPLSSSEMTRAMMGEVLSSDSQQQQTETPTSVAEMKNTTFRSDVRNEWVDAMFGKDFFPLASAENDTATNLAVAGTNSGETGAAAKANYEGEGRKERVESGRGNIDISVKQGVGAAGVPHYVTYGAILDPNANARANQAQQQQHQTQQQTQQQTPKSKSLQSSVQSTPLQFTSSTSMLGSTTGGTFLASTSFSPRSDVNEAVDKVHSAQFDGTPRGAARYDDAADGKTPAPNYTSADNANARTQQQANATQQQQQQQQKLGITISRIPLGLYVHSISLDSEAYAAGISPGSILVSVNEGGDEGSSSGLGMLGERSDRALERLWCYAGLFSSPSSGGGNRDDAKSDNVDARNGNGSSSSKNGSNTKSNKSSKSSDPSTNKATKSSRDLQVRKPLLLKFYKSSKTYTALLLSGNPLRGINWAPVGNFALVHRVASGSIASECGVRRGTLVLGVHCSRDCDGDYSSCREGSRDSCRVLDHGGVAGRLRDGFGRGESITLTLGYTPAASRSGYHERDDKVGGANNTSTTNQLADGTSGKPSSSADAMMRSNNNSSSSNAIAVANSIRDVRDVEVRSRPVEYSSAMVETFFACTGPGAMAMVDDSTSGSGSGSSNGMLKASQKASRSSFKSSQGSRINGKGISTTTIAEVASYVASGGILPPGGVLEAAHTINNQQQSNTGSSSSGGSSRRSATSELKGFSPCPPLPPSTLLSQWNGLSSVARSMSYQSAGSYCETTYVQSGGPFERIAEHSGRGDAPFESTECMGLIWGIANGALLPQTTPATTTAASADDTDNQVTAVAPEKVFDSHLLQLLGVAISPTMGQIEKGQRLSEMLMDIVIDVALNDINLCQRLFFLLRSFIGDLEERKVPHISENSSGTSGVAMRCCRYAQRRLSGRMFDKSEGMEGEGAGRHCSEGYPINRESTCSTNLKKPMDYAELGISASESSIGRYRYCNGGYPMQEPSSPCSPLNVDGNAVTERDGGDGQDDQQQALQQIVTESSSEDVTGNMYENDGQQSTMTNGQNEGLRKKSKSKKILRMLKGGKSKRGLKKPSPDQSSTLAPNTSVAGDGGASHGSNANTNKRSPKTPGKSFSFPSVFHKQQQQSTALQTIDNRAPPPPPSQPATSPSGTAPSQSHTASLSRKFENMAWILRQLDNSCLAIEKNLMKTFSQKMADWALYPWSASKESALASVTHSFRNELGLMNPTLDRRSSSRGTTNESTADLAVDLSSLSLTSEGGDSRFPILNPVNPSELLTSVDADECYILPSAHFPLLLCFNAEHHVVESPRPRGKRHDSKFATSDRSGGGSNGGDTCYRTRVEIIGLHSTSLPEKAGGAFVVQGAVAGAIQESGVSDASRTSKDSASYRWAANNKSLVFETRSNWGHPKTLSLKVSSLPKCPDDAKDETPYNKSDVGCGFVDLSQIWEQVVDKGAFVSSVERRAKIFLFDSAEEFDQHGHALDTSHPREEGLELHLSVSCEVISFEEKPRKRLLLYKHGDDLRQELLAIQFIERCNEILIASGLDLKLKTFSCQPVGNKTGFIEWVRGTIPLSELCKTSGSSHPGSNVGIDSRQSSRTKEGLTTDGETAGNSTDLDESSGQEVADSLPPQSHRWFKYQSLTGLRQKFNGSICDNPIQDFLRSAAYDEHAPFMIRKDIMATYVKSCAGYCVITYLLGVGDRHLDNILLHQNGHLLHCDYSFILGQDPKTYLPMRITEEMIKGFGGRDSDNFAKFLFFTGAAFITLRRHNNLHSLLSHICNMVHAHMGDLSINQPPEDAILAMRGRFRLDLNDDDALAYIEDVVEKSITSKIWRAVDVMHSLGKHF